MIGTRVAGVGDRWQRDVASFVLGGLPPPPGRVLDVGCGDGWLVRELADRGYDAFGVDPEAPEDDGRLTRSRLEEFEADPFDAVVAVLSLHHVGELEVITSAIARLLGPLGVVVCVEFAWNLFDDDTARWVLERLPAEADEHNWLNQLCRPLRERHDRGEPLHADELVRSWASEHGFHTSVEMIDALRSRFVALRLEWGPYLYDDLVLIDSDEEREAIEQGRIAAMSFRFIGRLDPDPPAGSRPDERPGRARSR